MALSVFQAFPTQLSGDGTSTVVTVNLRLAIKNAGIVGVPTGILALGTSPFGVPTGVLSGTKIILTYSVAPGAGVQFTQGIDLLFA